MENRKDNNIIFDKISRLSIFLSVLVIFIHANNLKYYGLNESTKTIPWKVEQFVGAGLAGLAVPMFFMISGYTFFRNIDVNDKNVFQIVFTKQKRRIKTVLVPYLLWNTFGTIFYMVFPRIPSVASMMNGSAVDFSINNLLKGIFLHEYYFPLWYLATLIVLIILTPLVVVMINSMIVSALILVALVVGAMLNLYLPEISCQSSFYFIIGCVLAVNGKKIVECSYKKKVSVISGILLFIFAIVRSYSNLGNLNILLTLVSPGLLWIVFSNFKWKITWFQKQSFFVYTSHIIIVTSIDKILLKMSGGDKTAWIIGSYLIAPFLTLIVIYIISRLLNKYCNKLYCLICGGRG